MAGDIDDFLDRLDYICTLTKFVCLKEKKPDFDSMRELVNSTHIPDPSDEPCIVCLDRPGYLGNETCSHQNMCATCVMYIAQTTKRCPLCRSSIEKLKKRRRSQ